MAILVAVPILRVGDQAVINNSIRVLQAGYFKGIGATESTLSRAEIASSKIVQPRFGIPFFAGETAFLLFCVMVTGLEFRCLSSLHHHSQL
jgi:hypothetical protein